MGKVDVNNYEQVSERYGGFWIRVAASIIDGLIVGIPLVVVFIIFGLMMTPVDATSSNEYAPTLLIGFLIVYIVTLVAVALYYILTQASKMQATVGKKIMGLKVTDLNGNQLTFGRSLGRYFSMILSGMIFYIGYIMVAFTDKKQSLHDMIAGTIVLKK